MKVKVVKAKKALGFRAYIELMNLRLELTNRLAERFVDKTVKKVERELELYKKPGFYKDRKIKVVRSVPKRPRSEIIYVSFHKAGYEIKSGRNFIHRPLILYGNLRYAYVDLEHLITEEEKKGVLDDLKILNNGIISK